MQADGPESPTAYDLDNDPDFQAGLASILQPVVDRGGSADEIEALVDRAKAFYLDQKLREAEGGALGRSRPNPASMPPEPERSRLSAAAEPFTPASKQDPPFPTSFASLAALISSGVPLDPNVVPGMKNIPDKLNEERPSEAKLAGKTGAGKKPWE